MQESMRFYCTEDGRRYNVVAKIAHKGKVPEFTWVGEDDERPDEYKALQFPDMFDKKTGEQLVFPDLGKIMSSIQSGKMLPSTTSMDLFQDYGLQMWKQGNVADAIINQVWDYWYDHHYLPDKDHDFWKGVRARGIQNASPEDAAKRGQKWHGAIESALSLQEVFQLDDAEIPVFQDVMHKIDEYLKDIPGDNLELERFFVNTEHGYAGTADIRKGNHVFDVKTSDKPLFGKRGGLLQANWIFDDRPRQLAAYAIGLEIEKPILTNIFVRIPGPKCPLEEAGQVHFHTYSKETTERNILLWKTYAQAWYLNNLKDDALWKQQNGNGLLSS